jgi:hypothetical protein
LTPAGSGALNVLVAGIIALCILAALTVTPCLAIAGPVESSVWIAVSRANGATFEGYRLSRRSEGMGVVTTPSREIATAAHVVWHADAITVTDAKGAKFSARVLCIDKTVDVALLRVQGRLDDFATIRARPAVMGETVGVVERSDPDEAPRVASGVVGTTLWSSHGVPVPLILSGIKGEKGMSGGGLFDAAGELLGIVIRIDSRVGYLSALPISEICTRFSRCAGQGAAAGRQCPRSEGTSNNRGRSNHDVSPLPSQHAHCGCDHGHGRAGDGRSTGRQSRGRRDGP